MTLRRQKSSKPFGLPRTPFNPQTGTYLPLGEPSPFAEFTVVEVGHDVLLCSDRDGRQALVLKPWSLRASTFHGVTLDGVAYVSTAVDVRTATASGGEPIEQRVESSYAVSEKIMAYRRADRDAAMGVVGVGELSGITAGSYRLFWEDMNTAARGWSNPSDSIGFQVGLVVSPSAEGRQEFFTLDIYGEGVATLASAPTQSGVLARSTVTSNYFYRGEVVVARHVDGEWRVYKFFTLNTETIAPGALWLRPFALDWNGASEPSVPLTYDMDVGTQGGPVLQDVAFDYAEVVAALGDHSMLECFGDFQGTHLVSAFFLASNMVPIVPDTVDDYLCSIVPGQTNTTNGEPTFGATGFGGWATALSGSYMSNLGASLGGTMDSASNTHQNVNHNDAPGGLRENRIIAPPRIPGSPITPSQFSSSAQLSWSSNITDAVKAARPALSTLPNTVPRNQAAFVVAVAYVYSTSKLYYRFVPPDLSWRGAFVSVNGGSALVWS